MAYHHSDLSLFHTLHLFFTAAGLKSKSPTVAALSGYLSIQQHFETCQSIGTGHDSQPLAHIHGATACYFRRTLSD